MLFHSSEFFLFFPLVYLLYWLLPHRAQNRMLLLASYVFYGWWDWRFLSLIWLSTLVDYFCGLRIEAAKEEAQRKIYVRLSILTNLGILGIFKYFNFFADNFRQVATALGWNPDPVTLQLVLPIGISFYTFQTMSYTLDIYRRQMSPTRNFWDFALFVAFFPQLVAGPIERARRLLPQIQSPRKVTRRQFVDGAWLIAWGYYKKVFIADNLAGLVDGVFLKTGIFSGGEALMGLYAFAFQIYGDFSGYSDIARGLSKWMGIEIMENFRSPLHAPNPADLWSRWHISLTTWVRDYLFYPLASLRIGLRRMPREMAMILSWALMGLWHGASWMFVLWGLYWAIILVVHRGLMPSLAKIQPARVPLKRTWFWLRVGFMFQLSALGALFFRSGSLAQAGNLLNNIWSYFSWTPQATYDGLRLLFFVLPLIVIDGFEKDRNNQKPVVFAWPAFARWFVYLLIFYSLMIWGDAGEQPFIYFQF